MLSIFSCGCWPSVCLWGNVYLGLLPIFWLGCLFFQYWVVWAVCVFWILTSCQSHHLQIFSPVPYVVFSFCWWFPLLCKSFYILIMSHLFIFAFISFALGDWSKKILLWFMSKNILPMFSSRSFVVSCLIFRPLNHFEFIFSYGVRECSNLLIYMWLSSFPNTICWRDSFLHCIVLPTLS